jgi:hypothetical protein
MDSDRMIRIILKPRAVGSIPKGSLDALLSLEIPVIFTGEEIFAKHGMKGLSTLGIKRGDVVASLVDVIEALYRAGKLEEGDDLARASEQIRGGVTFEAGCFKALWNA